MIGLVLTAGGARGAYQVGVLKRVAQLGRLSRTPSPFAIVTGASAGAINGTAIAAGSDDFPAAAHQLADIWSALKMSDVFRTGTLALSMRSARWLQDLSLGGLIGGGRAQSLLDFSPLRHYLSRHLAFDGITRSIERGHLYAVAVSATNYYSGKAYTFIQGAPLHPLWKKSRRLALAVKLEVDHVWASCSIPIVFQPVKVRTPVGDYYFGDGGLRLTTPLSPAIRLGADRVFGVGIRSQDAAEERSKAEYLETGGLIPVMKRPPPVAQVLGTTMNAIFLDHLDSDLEHLSRMNEIARTYEPRPGSARMREPMRVIDPLIVHPSVDLAALAEKHDGNMPRFMRYLMEGLGHSRSQSADLLSYLLFDSDYVRALIDLGYKDADARIDEIEDFLFSGSDVKAGRSRSPE